MQRKHECARACTSTYSWAEQPQLAATQSPNRKLQREAAFLSPNGNYWSQQSQSEIVLAKANAAFPHWKPRRGFRYRWKLIASDFQFQRQSSLIPKWIFIQEQSHVCSHYFRLSTFLDLLPCMLGWVEGFRKKLWVRSSSPVNQQSTAHLHQLQGHISYFVFFKIHILWSIYISINPAGISFKKGKKPQQIKKKDSQHALILDKDPRDPKIKLRMKKKKPTPVTCADQVKSYKDLG